MSDLKALAQWDSIPPVEWNPNYQLTYDQLVSRIGTLMMPYAQNLGIEAQTAFLLVRFAAGCAVGLIREAEIERIRADVAEIKDERPTKE